MQCPVLGGKYRETLLYKRFFMAGTSAEKFTVFQRIGVVRAAGKESEM